MNSEINCKDLSLGVIEYLHKNNLRLVMEQVGDLRVQIHLEEKK